MIIWLLVGLFRRALGCLWGSLRGGLWGCRVAIRSKTSGAAGAKVHGLVLRFEAFRGGFQGCRVASRVKGPPWKASGLSFRATLRELTATWGIVAKVYALVIVTNKA